LIDQRIGWIFTNPEILSLTLVWAGYKNQDKPCLSPKNYQYFYLYLNQSLLKVILTDVV